MQDAKDEETQEKQNEAEKEREAWPGPGLTTPGGVPVLTTVSFQSPGNPPSFPHAFLFLEQRLSGSKIELGNRHSGGTG